MGFATMADIVSAVDWDYTTVDVAGWGTVRIRALSAQERLDMAERVADNNGPQSLFRAAALVIALSLVDENGRQLFGPEDDPNILLTKNWSNVEKLFHAIMAFNGIADDAAEELEKN